MDYNIISESAFEENYCSYLRNSGIYNLPMKLLHVPGFPDRGFFSGNGDDYNIWVEFKSFMVSIDKPLRSIFEKTQPPFYVEYLGNTKANNIYFLFRVMDRENEYTLPYYEFGRISIELARKIPFTKYRELERNCDLYLKTTNKSIMLQHIRFVLDGKGCTSYTKEGEDEIS